MEALEVAKAGGRRVASGGSAVARPTATHSGPLVPPPSSFHPQPPREVAALWRRRKWWRRVEAAQRGSRRVAPGALLSSPRSSSPTDWLKLCESSSVGGVRAQGFVAHDFTSRRTPISQDRRTEFQLLASIRFLIHHPGAYSSLFRHINCKSGCAELLISRPLVAVGAAGLTAITCNTRVGGSRSESNHAALLRIQVTCLAPEHS